MSMPTVGFAGMTHLGIVSAAAIAAKGFLTVCYDGDADLVAALVRGKLPIVEPGLPELMAASGARQSFCADLATLSGCEVVYVAQDVPTDADGASDVAPVRGLIDDVASALAPHAIMVVLSQVPPGFIRGLKLPPHERLYYQVETLVFGRAVEQSTRPERFIVGCGDPARPLPPAYAALLDAFGCPIIPMRYESAELAKISINMCLVGSISVANMLAELCESIGADWSEIVPGLQLDRRIGFHSYLKPGLGIAGGNLERDLATVARLAETHGTDAGLVRAWQANSRHRRDWAVRTIREALVDERPDARIAVWGLAYKENTNSVRNSPALATIAQLPSVRLTVHDPVVPASVVAHPSAVGTANPLEAVRGADALMILTPWPQYREIPARRIAEAMSGRLVLDPYGVLDPQDAKRAGLIHCTLGRPRPRGEF